MEIAREVVDEKSNYEGDEEEEGAAGSDSTLPDELQGEGRSKAVL